VSRCPDSATCKAIPVKGVCPFHADHFYDEEQYADAERRLRYLPQEGD
jgi:hypothetical protein